MVKALLLAVVLTAVLFGTLLAVEDGGDITPPVLKVSCPALKGAGFLLRRAGFPRFLAIS
jgi:hypothetical protein